MDEELADEVIRIRGSSAGRWGDGTGQRAKACENDGGGDDVCRIVSALGVGPSYIT
jgi:hypothetical protein